MEKLLSLGLVSCLSLVALFVPRLSTCRAATPPDQLAEEPDFKPLVEAELPAGFPTYTPVGKIEVKEYPAYRKAQASGNAAFWTLFSHIKTNDIAMTAPVELTFKAEGLPVGKEQSMAFLYASTNLGRAGKQGGVEVFDVPAATVVSIGVRGARSEELVKQATERLRAWLTENQPAFVQQGPVRILGYNSPFVPRERQFFEVQIPVSRVNSGAPVAAAG